MGALLAQSGTVIQQTPPVNFAVGWGTLALINAGLAQTKRHSALLWWALSLLLGPVATFIIVAFLETKVDVTRG